MLHAHLSPEGLDPVIGLDNTHSVILIEQLKTWLAAPDTHLTVRPIIDLAAERTTTGYTPSPTLRDQVVLTNPTCVFPHCNRSSRTADLDHIEPYDTGGATTSANLAPLCRQHHRLKTFSTWTYRRTGPGRFTWTSPHGHTYTVDPTGTDPPPPPPPD